MDGLGSSYLSELLEQKIPGEAREFLQRILGDAIPLTGDEPRYDIVACGRFNGAELPHMLAYLQDRQASGAFVVIDGDAERAIFLARGMVVGAISTVLFERLGRLLYKAEVVTKEDSDTLVDAEENFGIEALLLWLSIPHLHWAVERRVWEAGAALALVKRGHFLFVEGDPVIDGPGVSIDPGQVVHEGMRLKQDMGSAVPAPGEKLEPIPMEAPPPRVTRELKPIDITPETAREIVKRIREAETAGQR
jgi:hypothetical protein